MRNWESSWIKYKIETKDVTEDTATGEEPEKLP